MSAGDDDFNLTVSRPEGVSDERWENLKARIGAEAEPIVSEILGTCVDHSWCRIAGDPEHADFHTGDTVDLVPAADPGDPDAVPAASAWITETRGHRPKLVVDAGGELLGDAFCVEIDLTAALVLLLVTVAGASEDRAVDARQQLIALLEEVAK